MSKVFNLGVATDLIRNIADQMRCTLCDENKGSRVRYPCGHCACTGCAETAVECPACPTPNSSSQKTLALDPVVTKRARNTENLLKTFQDTFHIDVYGKKRISEQLRIEKEVFPRCIQAEHKYVNKRKTTHNLSIKRSISTIFPGENMSPPGQMDKSMHYVKKWLEQNEKVKPERSPFTDLNVNSPRQENVKHRTRFQTRNILESKENITKPTRKRPYFKSTLANKHNENTDNISSKRIKKTNLSLKKLTNKPKFFENDESGIVIDDCSIIIDDSPIDDSSVIIDGSPIRVIDKDEEACLEVLAADKHAMEFENTTPNIELKCDEIVKYTDDVERTLTKSVKTIAANENKTSILSPSLLNKPETNKTVPFYKRSNLYNKRTQSPLCKLKTDAKNSSITLEMNNYLITVSVSDNSKLLYNVKTDDPYKDKIKEIDDEEKIITEPSPVGSEDLFKDDLNHIKDDAIDDSRVNRTVQIEKRYVTDSGSESEGGGEITVVADVHNENDLQLQNILSPLKETVCAPGMRTRRYVASSDSSDKENRDPNVGKRTNTAKKDEKKKKFKY